MFSWMCKNPEWKLPLIAYCTNCNPRLSLQWATFYHFNGLIGHPSCCQTRPPKAINTCNCFLKLVKHCPCGTGGIKQVQSSVLSQKWRRSPALQMAPVWISSHRFLSSSWLKSAGAPENFDPWTGYWLTNYWLTTDWLTDCWFRLLPDWLATYCLTTEWLSTDSLIDNWLLVEWLTDWLTTEWLNGWVNDWLTGWLTE
jgi:hypothetical protein